MVKIVRPDQVADETSLRGLRREVATLAEVNHPVVVRELRHELEGERPHVVLEHLDGPRLSSLIRRYGPLQEQQYLPLAIDIASALHYFGHVGVVHLDIKPSNIIMGAPARLIDLSVARSVDRAAARSTTSIGTDVYMAPEQCDPGSPARPARPATSGAWARPCSRRSPATARSTRATPTPHGSRTASPSWSTRPTSFPSACPTRSRRSCTPPSSATRPTGRCPHELAERARAGADPRSRQAKLTFKVKG